MQNELNFNLWRTLFNLTRLEKLGIIATPICTAVITGALTIIFANCKGAIVDDGGPDRINGTCKLMWGAAGAAYGFGYGLFGSVTAVISRRYIDHRVRRMEEAEAQQNNNAPQDNNNAEQGDHPVPFAP